MTDERSNPVPDSPPWPVAEVDGRAVVAFNAGDVERAAALLSEVEAQLLTALNFIRIRDADHASQAVQAARSRIARWSGDLSGLKERLGSRGEQQ